MLHSLYMLYSLCTHVVIHVSSNLDKKTKKSETDNFEFIFKQKMFNGGTVTKMAILFLVFMEPATARALLFALDNFAKTDRTSCF